MPNVQLTYDVWELIIDILGDELDLDSDDRASLHGLRNLALTCKAMVPRCRKHLFSTIDLTSGVSESEKNQNRLSDRIGRLHELISNLEIVHHIRHLRHRILLPDDVRLPGIFDVLCQSTFLRSVDICGARKYWDTFPRRLQVSLAGLIRHPTITKLKISIMFSVPLSILLGSTSGTGITHLTLRDVRFARNSDLEESPDLAIDVHEDNVDRFRGAGAVVLSTLRPTYLAIIGNYDHVRFLMQARRSSQLTKKNSKIIDLSGLQEVRFEDVDCNDCMDVVHQVLLNSKELESLCLNVVSALSSWAGFGASLSASHVRTLSNLSLGTCVKAIQDDDDDNGDPLYGLVSQLGIIAGMNILKTLHLNAFVDSDNAYRSSDWSALDALLTRPGSFPKLKTVRITIIWTVWESDGDQAEIKARITERNFPNLLESTVLEFEVSSEVHLLM